MASRLRTGFQLTLAALVLTTLGCGSWKVVPLATNPADNAASLAAKRVAPGDTVRVVLKNGQQSEFKVRSVEDDAVSGLGGGAHRVR